ncbi:FAD-binding oxidoreductase [Ideonella livida]|uniref:FAD-binding oxidoreductase n=1 Tax=Ideonella livida TaxID=2707176 RepID=A0A7C9TIN2_9BURK|nr:FAD-binding oxidoreductase [Ideonella livida]NDY91439.1 FAD-binding oxidoreductase [Ideonella livida]
MSAPLLELSDLLGPKGLQATDDPQVAPWLQDWRGRYRGRPLAVASPEDHDQVQATLAWSRRHGIPVVPQGGNTGLVGGATPDTSGGQLLLSLRRLCRHLTIDADNQTVCVDAGCTLQQLQEAANAAGWLFPLSLGSESQCTVGGVLATNAGGVQVLHYGTARDLCLGLAAVLADGSSFSQLGGLRKDNTGYDLRHLLIGSEGTLGVITRATLKLFPRPARVITAWLQLESLEAAVHLFRLARQALSDVLTACEVMGPEALNVVLEQMPERLSALPDTRGWHLLIDISLPSWAGEGDGAIEWLHAQLEAGRLRRALVAQDLRQAQALWAIRAAIPPAQSRDGLNVKHDIALPVSALPRFHTACAHALESLVPGARPVVFGHLGDGNLHYNVRAPRGESPADFRARHEGTVNRCVHDLVTAHGGSISAEHGIGSLKADALAHYKAPAALAAMRSIKRALDPLGLLNPGKVLVPD